MRKTVFAAGLLASVLAVGPIECHAEKWVKNDLTNNSIAANYHDADSVKVKDKVLRWTEKTVLTERGTKSYATLLSQFPACKKNIEKMGDVTYHQMDFEIKNGKFRAVAKRNYNKSDALVCTDKDMGKDLDTSWHRLGRRSPMEQTYYNLVTMYKLGDL